MTPKFSRRLIAATGGNTAFRIALGIEQEPGSLRRVNNWSRRGIPIEVQLTKARELRRAIRNAKRRGCVL